MIVTNNLVGKLREIGFDSNRLIEVAFSLQEKGAYDTDSISITHGNEKNTFRIVYK